MKGNRLSRSLLIAAIGVVALFLALRYNIPEALRGMLAWVGDQGFLGIVAFIAIYILATVFFIPGSILTLGAGFVFGVVYGTLTVSVASTVGAFLAFLVGRYVARDWVAEKTGNNPKFKSIDEAVGREGWKIVLLTRLSPIFPFNLLNYAYGLTGVTGRAFFFASWIGMLPGTVMYVYFGSLAANLATLGQASAERGPLQWILYGIGLVATVAVTFFVTRLARRALSDSMTLSPKEA